MRRIRPTFVNFSDAGPAIPTQGWRANTSTKCRRTKVNTTLFLLLSTTRFRYGGEFLLSCVPTFCSSSRECRATQWGKLTDDDMTIIEGKRDQLVGKIQERYGYQKDQAEKEVVDWETRNEYRW